MRCQTYEAAFGKSLTNEVLQFMRRVGKVNSYVYGPGNPFFEAWAEELTKRKSTPPIRWQPAELGVAVFAGMLFSEEDWGDRPEIDHYDACYELLCSWASIEPSTAREQGLGLVVTTGEPLCIGLLNHTFYKCLRQIEEYKFERQAQGEGPTPPPEERNKTNFLLADDWLSFHVNPYTRGGPRTDLVYELYRLNSALSLSKPHWIADADADAKETELVPGYTVVGVWFPTNIADDQLVGARYTNVWTERDGFVL